MDAATFYQLGMKAVEIASDYLEGIVEKPVYRPMTPSERQLLFYQQLPGDMLADGTDRLPR